ncbi:response regulator transcription factor [Limnohabitans sp.]|uniref:response regulator transcription factor n=1 Tax=Limnohabitans sp. TaxID=1907725 RepID=UPI00286ECA03|nr:response regulator transcription factor [Limnohabitans sp.]
MAIAVGIIEDDPVVSKYIATLISTTPLCELAGVAANKAHAYGLIAQNCADIYLVDIGLPDVNGIDLIKKIKQECSNAHVMVLTSFGDMRHVLQSIEVGATGYLLKDDRPDELIGRLVSLYNGNSPVSPGVAKHLIKKITNTDQQDVDRPDPDAILKFGLSKREVQVLAELRSPNPVKLIADRLNISYFTVNQHVRRVYRKLGVNSRTAALDKAFEYGLF